MTLPVLDLLDLRFIVLGVNDMIVKLGVVANFVDAHAGYKDMPADVPGPPHFRDLAARLQQADQDAANMGRGQRALRDELHQEAAVALTLFGQYAVLMCVRRKDPSYLENIGIDKKANVAPKKRNAHGPTGATKSFSVKHGPESGSVIFRVAAVLAAAHYDIQYCLGDPNDAAAWSESFTFLNTRSMQMGGLEPGKVYYFRVRCFGANGFGPWSTVIKIMVI